MNTLSDEVLMERFCQGDEGAFDTLFTRHAPRIQGFLIRMVRDGALAEDLLQTTMLSLVRARSRYTPGTRFVPWLLTIAANAARDSMRHQKYVDAAARDVQAQEKVAQPEVGDPGLRKRIEEALAALPPQQREAVVLHKIEGLSFDEIAGGLGITVMAARIRAHRGYERLRELLGDVGVEV